MTVDLRKVAILSGVVFGGGYLLMAIASPQGLRALRAQRQVILQLEAENAELRKDVARRSELVQKLKNSDNVEDLIRERLKRQHEGDTIYLLEPRNDQATPATPRP
ncbi:MAG: septum formation initiator family protein [Candidatus Solibacter usitatus]|nr:septum formation initiator family protein [Candidatus Solibacter usitatus]